MTTRAIPFDGQTVTELEWRRLMRWIMPNGVLRGQDNELAVSQRAAGANMSVDVATGQAFAVGHHFRSDAIENVAVTNNGSGNPRIDAVVVGYDFVANSGTIYVLAGTAAVAPVPPTITQDVATKWETVLAYLYVPGGESTSIDTAEIGDAREWAAPQAQDAERLVRLATAAALAASTITGINRVADANGALANIDGTAAVVGDDVLDKDHGTGSARGIWRIVDLGSASKPWRMVRSPLADESAKVRAGLWVRVAEGTANADTGWMLTTNNPITLGSTSLTFGQFPPAAVDVTPYITKATLDANSVLIAVSDDTPIPRAMGASTFLARLASGDIVAASVAQAKTLLALASTDLSDFATAVDARVGLKELAETIVGADAATITFSSISGSYRHLLILLHGQSNAAADLDTLLLQFNGDGGANYEWERDDNANATPGGNDNTGQTAIQLGSIAAVDSHASAAGSARLHIPDYARTTWYKSVIGEVGYHKIADANGGKISHVFGAWQSTAAITSITLDLTTGSFETGTVATLYGYS